MSHKMLRPVIVKVSVLGAVHFPLCMFGIPIGELQQGGRGDMPPTLKYRGTSYV